MAKNEEVPEDNEQEVVPQEERISKPVKDVLDSLGIPSHNVETATVNDSSIDIVLKDSSDQTPTNP